MKTGDRVISKYNTLNLTKGKEYTLLKQMTNLEYFYVLNDKGIEEYYHMDAFEPVDEFEPTKSFLMKHENEYIVEHGFVMSRVKDIAFSNYNEDLTHKETEFRDIFKVHRIPETVWKREGRKEMTLEEIEKELGYKVKLKGE